MLDAPEQSPAGIHGVGGMGKTALAQAFAYKEADAFAGDCWLLRCEGRERHLIIIDALDEAGKAGRNPLVEMLARNAQRP